MQKTLLTIILVLVVAGLGWYFWTGTNVTTISSDTVIAGDYRVESGKRVVLANGATLTVEGNLMLEGELACENGPLTLTVKGNADIRDRLTCSRAEDNAPNNIASGIALVVGGSLVFASDAIVVSNANVQVVSDASRIATTPEAVDRIYDDAGANTGAGPRIGPLVGGDEASLPSFAPLAVALRAPAALPSDTSAELEGLIPTAHAQAAPAPCIDQNGNVVPNCVRLSGKWVMGQGQPTPPGVSVPTPPKGVHKIILNFDFGPGQEVNLVDLNLSGPDGRNGESDINTNCTARGSNGEAAFRMRLAASNIRINNFGLWLGNGGAGGEAETTEDCDPGRATGGRGGDAGNFKMSASGSFEIDGAFNIFPGRGGDGGDATAYGKDGTDACPGTKGGDATATGGDGGKNKKELAAVGAVAGTSNVTVGPVNGGKGGIATTDPGKGGSGTTCKCNGGDGGKGTATAGKGGDASLAVLGGAGTANGGNGGDVDAHGGAGGNGGSCNPSGPGGNGGKGGDAKSNFGKGGSGTSANGTDGTVTDETGGNGGNGGDGCKEGKGGKGGAGNPRGTDGTPGKNLCGLPMPTPTPTPTPRTEPTPPSTDSTGSPQAGSGQATPTPTPTPPKTTSLEVIRYNGKYLPRTQLIIEDEAGCGADHWHAASGSVTATDGSVVPDPGPQCGYGKVSETPLIVIDAPSNY